MFDLSPVHGFVVMVLLLILWLPEYAEPKVRIRIQKRKTLRTRKDVPQTTVLPTALGD